MTPSVWSASKVVFMVLAVVNLNQGGAEPQRWLSDATAASNKDILIFPGQICSLEECQCEWRKRHSTIAVCECNRKTLRLSPDMMASGEVTDLRVSASENCAGVLVEQDTFSQSSIKRVRISGPTKVVIKARSFQISAKQRNFGLQIQGAKELQLEAHAFSGKFSSIRISNITSKMSIDGKTFVNIHGPQTTVAFYNVTIDDVMASAFSGSRLGELSISNSSIKVLSTNAIRRCNIHVLRIVGSSLQRVETAATSESQVTQLQLSQTVIGQLQPAALQLALEGTAQLTGNLLRQLRDGAFVELRPATPQARLEFHNNTVEGVEDGGLSFSELLQPSQLSVSQLSTHRRCSCGLLDWLQLLARRLELAERLAAVTSCVSADGSSTIGRYVRDVCSGGSAGGSGAEAEADDTDDTSGRRRAALLAAVAVGALFATSCVTGLVCWRLGRRRRRRQRHKATVIDRKSHTLVTGKALGGVSAEGGGWRLSHPPARAARSPLVIAVPDVMTYTETEVHVVLESLESMPEGPVCPPTPPKLRLPEENAESRCRKSCPL